MYHTQHLLLSHADCLLCLQIHTVRSLHLFSQCIRLSFDSPFLFPLNVCAEVLLLGFKVFVGGLASVRGLLTLPTVCVCVFVCTYSDDTLSFCSWDHGSAHGACVHRTRKVRAVRRNLQRMHCCCGASTKLMGILGSTFRTSQVWHQNAYYSHQFVLLVWMWFPGLIVCAGSWHNGLVFYAFIHAHCPDFIDFNALQPSHHTENLNIAFDVSNIGLGIPQLLDAEGW
jgi:hypothetical protein